MRLLTIYLCLSLYCFGNTIKIDSYNHFSKYEKTTTNILNSKVEEISQNLDLDSLTINVLLFNDHGDFYNSTGLPERIPGAYILSKNTIFLKTPDITKMDRDQYKLLIFHELLHAIQNQKVSLVLFPDWFNEGFAEYFSGNFKIEQKIELSKILLAKQPVNLQNLENITHKYRHSAADKYLLSASVIEFLKINFGENFFNNLFKDVNQTKNFEQSFLNISGLTIEQLNFYWSKYLDKRYKKLFLLDIQYIIWLFLPFLFIFCFIVKQILNQTIINRWKYEKLEEQLKNIFNNQFNNIEQSPQRTSSVSS